MAYSNLNNPANFQLQGFWQFGMRFLSSAETSLASEHYRVIKALSNAVVNTSSVHGDSFSSKVLYAGEELYGLFDSVTVNSGDVVLAIAG